MKTSPSGTPYNYHKFLAIILLLAQRRKERKGKPVLFKNVLNFRKITVNENYRGYSHTLMNKIVFLSELYYAPPALRPSDRTSVRSKCSRHFSASLREPVICL